MSDPVLCVGCGSMGPEGWCVWCQAPRTAPEQEVFIEDDADEGTGKWRTAVKRPKFVPHLDWTVAMSAGVFFVLLGGNRPGWALSWVVGFIVGWMFGWWEAHHGR